MFSPGTKKPNYSSRKDRNLGQAVAPGSPATPFPENRRSLNDSPIPNRPATGTPAPWASRLSVLARIPAAKRSENVDDAGLVQPVYVGEFPQVVRDEQASLLRKRVPLDQGISGGMDRETSLSWIICGGRLFIWSYLSPAASRQCVTLQLPSHDPETEDISQNLYHSDDWLLCVVNWDISSKGSNKRKQQCSSVGVVMCNRQTRSLIYWPDVYSDNGSAAVFSPPDESEMTSSPVGRSTPNKEWRYSWQGSSPSGINPFNSLIASAVPNARGDSQKICVALACSSDGELWQFHCSSTSIQRRKVCQGILRLSSLVSDSGQILRSKGYPRSLVWRFSKFSLDGYNREFFLLTDNEIQCYMINFYPDINVSRLWSYEIVGTDGDLGIKKDLAGQKRIWPLDMQVGENGKVITVLVATFCKDRVSSSNYIQYSLLTMHYKSELSASSESIEPIQERILERKDPVQVVIPKARLEENNFLLSINLRVGGKPSGSVVILSGDGTAIVSHYLRNSTRLYQFGLPYDAGKVLDASIFPSTEDGEDGAWVVLTEKAGVWAIPEKAILLGGVEPPERSLSHKGLSSGGPAQESSVVSRGEISEAWEAKDRQGLSTGIVQRTAEDEESESLLGHLFHCFLSSGYVNGSLEKLRNAGAFERDGETNVFARASKSIVDTLAKHWTTTRGAEIVATAVVSNQLMDKQLKHQKFLQFLALSKCHEELHSRQKQVLQTIMEHGEKLAGMIQLRELQNRISQSRTSSEYFKSDTETSGSLWDVIQKVGEKARRNTVLLMDRDNAEVFYSKVSDIEEVFHCIKRHCNYLIGTEQPISVQIQRVCELSDASVTLVRAAMQYKNDHHVWYPPPEKLTPWYCHVVVYSGMWAVASFMLQLLNKTTGLDLPAKSEIYSYFKVLVEVLLDVYSGAISAKIEREEEHKVLLEEYWNQRDALLECLYQQIKGFAEAGSEGLVKGEDEQNGVMFEQLSSHLLPIAKRHGGYQILWHICNDLNDLGLLRNLMHECAGARGGFSYFVFQQFVEKQQFPKLLRLGEEFQEELSNFLQQYPHLLWLHQVFLQEFSSASETLHALALLQNDSSILAVEDENDPELDKLKPTLSERRHLLNLSKIATLAGKDAENVTRIERIDADLKILQLQKEILTLLPDDEEIQDMRRRLLPPTDLIELCLNSHNPMLVLRAFDVFAWTSASFRNNNKSLLEECWKTAADQDDWGRLYEASINEGWTDEDSLRILRETMLFQASRRCYGPEADTFEGGFDEILPLRQENSDDQFLKDSGSSVEAILMRHIDFPDAGKLMLTAIMLGGAHIDLGGDESLSQME